MSYLKKIIETTQKIPTLFTATQNPKSGAVTTQPRLALLIGTRNVWVVV